MFLGLYTVRLIADLHRGSVEATSAGPGKGCVFRLTLPAHLAEPPGGPAEAAPGPVAA